MRKTLFSLLVKPVCQSGCPVVVLYRVQDSDPPHHAVNGQLCWVFHDHLEPPKPVTWRMITYMFISISYIILHYTHLSDTFIQCDVQYLCTLLFTPFYLSFIVTFSNLSTKPNRPCFCALKAEIGKLPLF